MPRTRMSTTRYRALVALALAVAAAALVVGLRATRTGDDHEDGSLSPPDAVEMVQPAQGDEVLRQSEIGVDLAPGHEALLIVNGEQVPDDQLRRVPEQNQVYFRPGEGTIFPSLPGGTNCVSAIVWRSADGRGPADQTYTWCFEAT